MASLWTRATYGLDRNIWTAKTLNSADISENEGQPPSTNTFLIGTNQIADTNDHLFEFFVRTLHLSENNHFFPRPPISQTPDAAPADRPQEALPLPARYLIF